MKRLVFILVVCAMPMGAAALDEPSFAQRLALAQRAEHEPVAQGYLEKKLIPALENADMKKRVAACLKIPGASNKSFTMVATVATSGTVGDVDYRPRTNTGRCLAAALQAMNQLAAPPGQYGAGLPFYIDWNLSK